MGTFYFLTPVQSAKQVPAGRPSVAQYEVLGPRHVRIPLQSRQGRLMFQSTNDTLPIQFIITRASSTSPNTLSPSGSTHNPLAGARGSDCGRWLALRVRIVRLANFTRLDQTNHHSLPCCLWYSPCL